MRHDANPLKERQPVFPYPFPYVAVALIANYGAAFFWQASFRTVNGARIVCVFGSTPAVLLGDKNLPPEHAILPAEMALLTSMFLHGRWMQLIYNMLYLWVLGDNVENSMGYGRFFVFYLLRGFMASCAHIANKLNSEVTTIGASGNIFRILGIYLGWHSRVLALTLVVRFPRRLRLYSSWACGLGCSSSTPR